MSDLKSPMRKGAGARTFDVINLIALFLFCLTILYPFWTTILLSFSGVNEGMSLGFHLWITDWKLSAYDFIIDRYGHLGRIFYNSIFRTVVGTTLTIMFTLMAAYPLSKRRIPGRNAMTIFLLVTMFFSGGLIPTYLLIRSLGLINTRWVLILPSLTMTYYIIITRNFLMTIDDAYEEAAFMDGAGYPQILAKIIIPLSTPVIATIALWHAVHHWNAWFDALIYTRGESKMVLQLLLRRLVIEAEAAFEEEMRGYEADLDLELPSAAVKSAVTIVTIGPIILLYPFLQRYFVKGVFVGSLKG